MRVTQSQIVRGIGGYLRDEILPKMGEDRAVQIVASIAVNAAMANEKLLDSVFGNEMVQILLDYDGDTYDVSGLTAAMRDAIDKYGALPIKLPHIPFVSASELTLRMDGKDVDAMKRRIESGQDL